MGFSSGNPNSAMADINVTPLVDVMLVLLIIFMVTAPLMNAGVDIDLPRADAPPISQDADQQLMLKIDSAKRIFIQDNEVTVEELPIKLKTIAESNPDQPAFLMADGTVPYSEIAFLLAAAKKAGIPRVGLVFEPGVEER